MLDKTFIETKKNYESITHIILAMQMITYAVSSKINLTVEKFEEHSRVLFTFLKTNSVKADAYQSHFLVTTKLFPIKNAAKNSNFKIMTNSNDIER